MPASEFSESVEDYLGVILDLEKTQRAARAKDIADRLDVNDRSVTGALNSVRPIQRLHASSYFFHKKRRNPDARDATPVAPSLFPRHVGAKWRPDFSYSMMGWSE